MVYISPNHLEWLLNSSFNRKTGKKYGVIECDPLVLKGLDRTVSQSYHFFPFSCLETFKLCCSFFQLAFLMFYFVENVGEGIS